MLKDTLLKLKSDAGDARGLCTLAKCYKSMDEETQVAFVDVCKSAAFTTDISRALRADGHPVSRDILSRRRKCFTTGNPECCMLVQKGTSK
jgi:hypothetical protein